MDNAKFGENTNKGLEKIHSKQKKELKERGEKALNEIGWHPDQRVDKQIQKIQSVTSKSPKVVQKKLSKRRKQYIDDLIVGNMSMDEVAHKWGITRQAVSAAFRSEPGVEYVKELLGRYDISLAKMKVKVSAHKGLKVLTEILEMPHETLIPGTDQKIIDMELLKLKKDVAEKMIDKAGMSEETKGGGININIFKDMASRLKKTSDIIDVQAEVVG